MQTLYLQDHDKSNANPGNLDKKNGHALNALNQLDCLVGSVCQHEAYMPTITANVPSLVMLDGESLELRTASEPLHQIVRKIAEARANMKTVSHNFEPDNWITTSGMASCNRELLSSVLDSTSLLSRRNE